MGLTRLTRWASKVIKLAVTLSSVRGANLTSAILKPPGNWSRTGLDILYFSLLPNDISYITYLLYYSAQEPVKAEFAIAAWFSPLGCRN